MKNLIIFSLTILFALPTFGQKPKVLVIDPHMDGSKLESQFDVQHPVHRKSKLPDLDKRDELFGGQREIASWDEVKKDIFYMDLKSKSLTELQQKYPLIPSKELQSLKEKR